MWTTRGKAEGVGELEGPDAGADCSPDTVGCNRIAQSQFQPSTWIRLALAQCQLPSSRVDKTPDALKVMTRSALGM